MEFQKQELIDYGVEFLLENDKAIFVTEYATALKVIDKIEELDIDIEGDILDVTSSDVEEDTIVYVQKFNDETYIVKDAFDSKGEIRYLESDYVLIQEGLLLDSLIDENVAFEEDIEFIGLKEEYDDSFDNAYEDVLDGDKDESFEDLIEEFTSNILETEGCPCCIQEVLYSFAEAIREFDDKELECNIEIEEIDLHEVLGGIKNLELVKALVRKIIDRNKF